MTQFRALRNFLRRPGEDVAAGDVLELDDAEAALLVAMPGTVEPVHARDRDRVISQPKIEWAAPDPEQRESAGIGHAWVRPADGNGGRPYPIH